MRSTSSAPSWRPRARVDATYVDLHVPGRAARRRAAGDGGRRRAPDVPGGRAEAPSRRAARRRCSRCEDDPEQLIQVAFPAAGVRPAAPLRHAGRSARPRRSKGHHGRRSQGVPRRATSGRRTPCSSSPATSPPTRSSRSSNARSAAGRAAPGAEAARPPGDAPRRPRAASILIDKPGAAQSQIRIGCDRRAALDAGLLRAARPQHGARRGVHLAAEHQPARSPRLRLRRRVPLRHAAERRAPSTPPPACRPTRPPRR